MEIKKGQRVKAYDDDKNDYVVGDYVECLLEGDEGNFPEYPHWVSVCTAQGSPWKHVVIIPDHIDNAISLLTDSTEVLAV
jgi:hypothetical protein